MVDAKFPCEPKDLNPKLGVPPATTAKKTTGVTYESPAATGKDMMTAKERYLYPEFKVDDKPMTKKPKCMTPSDAKAIKSDCDCSKVDTPKGS